MLRLIKKEGIGQHVILQSQKLTVLESSAIKCFYKKGSKTILIIKRKQRNGRTILL